MELKFGKTKQNVLHVELEDGRKLTVFPPKLKVIRMLENLEGDFDDTIQVIAKALSSNKEGITFTPDDVEENFDVGDLGQFMEGYSEFVKSISKSKN